MLRNMMYTGLKSSLKDISGHKFDNILHYDELLISLRQLEHEERHTTKKTATSKMATTTQKTSEFTELKAMICKLSTEVANIKSAQNAHHQPTAADKRPQHQRHRQPAVTYQKPAHQYNYRSTPQRRPSSFDQHLPNPPTSSYRMPAQNVSYKRGAWPPKQHLSPR